MEQVKKMFRQPEIFPLSESIEKACPTIITIPISCKSFNPANPNSEIVLYNKTQPFGRALF